MAEEIHKMNAPDPCLCQLRLFSEHLANVIAIPLSPNLPRKRKRWNQAQLLDWLKSNNVIEGRINRLLQWFRETGNKACHCNDAGLHSLNDLPERFTSDDSLEGLQKAHELSVWYVQTYHVANFTKPVFTWPTTTVTDEQAKEQPSLDDLNQKIKQLDASLPSDLQPYLLRHVDIAVGGLVAGFEAGQEHLRRNPWDIFGASSASSNASSEKTKALQAELDRLLE
ncbi:hypothetical protein VZH09_13855 (plasmid) [Synechococcus elongatus IITB7]|uniref:hypothetical protein n=1 Tax=Synechococcus elongatus TaxID=32046 RepID=UPI0030D26552